MLCIPFCFFPPFNLSGALMIVLFAFSLFRFFFSAEEVLIFILINGKPQHKTITSSKRKQLNTARLKWKCALNGAPTKSRREADVGVKGEQEADAGCVEQERELSLQPRPAGSAELGLGLGLQLGGQRTPSSFAPDSMQFSYYSGQKAMARRSAARCSQTGAVDETLSCLPGLAVRIVS